MKPDTETIVQMRDKGASIPEICRVVGVDRVQCQTILAAADGFKYIPTPPRMARTARKKQWWVK